MSVEGRPAGRHLFGMLERDAYETMETMSKFGLDRDVLVTDQDGNELITSWFQVLRHPEWTNDEQK